MYKRAARTLRLSATFNWFPLARLLCRLLLVDSLISESQPDFRQSIQRVRRKFWRGNFSRWFCCVFIIRTRDFGVPRTPNVSWIKRSTRAGGGRLWKRENDFSFYLWIFFGRKKWVCWTTKRRIKTAPLDSSQIEAEKRRIITIINLLGQFSSCSKKREGAQNLPPQVRSAPPRVIKFRCLSAATTAVSEKFPCLMSEFFLCSTSVVAAASCPPAAYFRGEVWRPPSPPSRGFWCAWSSFWWVFGRPQLRNLLFNLILVPVGLDFLATAPTPVANLWLAIRKLKPLYYGGGVDAGSWVWSTRLGRPSESNLSSSLPSGTKVNNTVRRGGPPPTHCSGSRGTRVTVTGKNAPNSSRALTFPRKPKKKNNSLPLGFCRPFMRAWVFRPIPAAANLFRL